MVKEIPNDCAELKCTKSARQVCPICLDAFCWRHFVIHRTQCGVPDEHPEIPEMMG